MSTSDNWTVTEVPLFDRKGRQVGVDRIHRHVNPPPEIPIPAGRVRVHCACGGVHIVPEAEWHKWGAMSLEDRAKIKQGGCDCKHFTTVSA